MPRYAWDVQDDSEPGPDIVPVTPSDSADQETDLGNQTITGFRALRANGAGIIRVTMSSGKVRQLNFAAAETRPGQFLRVWSTNTTATGIEGHV